MRTKFKNNPDLEGSVTKKNIGPKNGQSARQNALDFEQGRVNSYAKSPKNPKPGSNPPSQVKPKANR